MKISLKYDILFFLAYLMYLFSAFYTKTVFYPIPIKNTELLLQLIRYSAYILLTLYAFLNKQNKTELVFLVFLCAILLMLLYGSNHVLLFSLIFMYFTKNIEYERIIKCSFCFFMIMWSILFAAMLLGIIENKMIFTADYTGGRYRYCLGFKHPNNAAEYYIFTLMQFFWLKRNKIRCIHLIWATALSIGVFMLTLSKAGLIISILFCILCLFRKRFFKVIMETKLNRLLVSYLFPILSLINIYMILMYMKGNFNQLNLWLNGRLGLSAKAIVDYGIKFRGQMIIWNYDVGYYNIVDNSYIRDLIEYGLIGFTIIMWGYVSLMKYAIKKYDEILIIIIFCISLYAISENMLMYFPINPFIVMIGAAFKENKFIKGNSQHEKTI